MGKATRLAGLAGLAMASGALSAVIMAGATLGATQPGALIEAPVTVLYWVDPGTGCHYLLTGAGILYPRNHSDGVQVCDYSEDGWPLDQNLSYGDDGKELLPPAEPYPPTPKTMTAVAPTQQIKVVL